MLRTPLESLEHPCPLGFPEMLELAHAIVCSPLPCVLLPRSSGGAGKLLARRDAQGRTALHLAVLESEAVRWGKQARPPDSIQILAKGSSIPRFRFAYTLLLALEVWLGPSNGAGRRRIGHSPVAVQCELHSLSSTRRARMNRDTNSIEGAVCGLTDLLFKPAVVVELLLLNFCAWRQSVISSRLPQSKRFHPVVSSTGF